MPSHLHIFVIIVASLSSFSPSSHYPALNVMVCAEKCDKPRGGDSKRKAISSLQHQKSPSETKKLKVSPEKEHLVMAARGAFQTLLESDSVAEQLQVHHQVCILESQCCLNELMRVFASLHLLRMSDMTD